MRRAVNQIATGDFEDRVSRSRYGGKDAAYVHELDELKANVNRMGAELAGMNYMRKDFVSNVSHIFDAFYQCEESHKKTETGWPFHCKKDHRAFEWERRVPQPVRKRHGDAGKNPERQRRDRGHTQVTKSIYSVRQPAYKRVGTTVTDTILLTGATGYLGTELAARLARTSQSKIYALVRAIDEEEAYHRLRAAWRHDKELYQAIGTQILPVHGDFTKPGLGLEQSVRQTLEDCQSRCDFVVFRRTGNVEKWRINVYSL